MNKTILPVVVKPTPIPDELKYQLAGVHWLDFSDNFDITLRQLLEAVGTPRESPSPAPPPDSEARGSRRVMIIALVLVGLAILVVVAFIMMPPNGDEVTPTSEGLIAEVTAFLEQPNTPGQPEENLEGMATFRTELETAIAATRQAELKTEEAVGSLSPTPTFPLPSPTAAPPTPTHTPTPTPAATPSATPTATNTPTFEPILTPTTAPDFVIEDFEAFSDSLGDGFEINRNAGNEGQITLAGVPHISQGRQALALEFDIRNSPPNHYIGFDRALPPQDWSNYAALCFWIESDGSNRSLVLQLGESKYKFWKKIYSLSNGTGDYCISLNDPHQLNLRSIGYYGVYVEGPPTGQSIIYIDDIRLVN